MVELTSKRNTFLNICWTNIYLSINKCMSLLRLIFIFTCFSHIDVSERGLYYFIFGVMCTIFHYDLVFISLNDKINDKIIRYIF